MGKSPNLKPPWKKGQSGNLLGGKLHDPEMRAIKNLTKSELVTIANLIIKNDFETLQKLAKQNKGTSVLQRMIASVAVRIVSSGDMHALDILLNRLVGKVKDEIMQQMEIKTPQVIVTLPDNGRSAKVDETEDDYGF